MKLIHPTKFHIHGETLDQTESYLFGAVSGCLLKAVFQQERKSYYWSIISMPPKTEMTTDLRAWVRNETDSSD